MPYTEKSFRQKMDSLFFNLFTNKEIKPYITSLILVDLSNALIQASGGEEAAEKIWMETASGTSKELFLTKAAE